MCDSTGEGEVESTPPGEKLQSIYDSDGDADAEGDFQAARILPDWRKQLRLKQSICSSDTDTEEDLSDTEGNVSDAIESTEWRRQLQQAAQETTPINGAQVDQPPPSTHQLEKLAPSKLRLRGMVDTAIRCLNIGARLNNGQDLLSATRLAVHILKEVEKTIHGSEPVPTLDNNDTQIGRIIITSLNDRGVSTRAQIAVEQLINNASYADSSSLQKPINATEQLIDDASDADSNPPQKRGQSFDAMSSVRSRRLGISGDSSINFTGAEPSPRRSLTIGILPEGNTDTDEKEADETIEPIARSHSRSDDEEAPRSRKHTDRKRQLAESPKPKSSKDAAANVSSKKRLTANTNAAPEKRRKKRENQYTEEEQNNLRAWYIVEGEKKIPPRWPPEEVKLNGATKSQGLYLTPSATRSELLWVGDELPKGAMFGAADLEKYGAAWRCDGRGAAHMNGKTWIYGYHHVSCKQCRSSRYKARQTTLDFALKPDTKPILTRWPPGMFQMSARAGQKSKGHTPADDADDHPSGDNSFDADGGPPPAAMDADDHPFGDNSFDADGGPPPAAMDADDHPFGDNSFDADGGPPPAAMDTDGEDAKPRRYKKELDEADLNDFYGVSSYYR